MEIGRHRGMIANEHIKIGSNSYEKVKAFLIFSQNCIHEEIKYSLKVYIYIYIYILHGTKAF